MDRGFMVACLKTSFPSCYIDKNCGAWQEVGGDGRQNHVQRKQASTLMLIPVMVVVVMMMMTKLTVSFIEVSTFDLFNRSIL
jgi:hypothetical protein